MGHNRIQVLDDSPYPLTPKRNGRCGYTRKDGLRCRNHCTAGRTMCRIHLSMAGKCRGGHTAFGRVKKSKMAGYSKHIKSKALLAAFEEQLLDPDFKSLKNELGLLRTFAASCVAKMPDVDNLADLDTSSMILVLTFMKEVMTAVNAMTALEKRMEMTITASDVGVIINQVVEVMTKHIPDEDILAKIVADLGDVLLLTQPQNRMRLVRENDDAGTETGEGN